MDTRLTSEGIKQVNLIAEKLREKLIPLAFRSSLSRSSISLKIVLKYHPECEKTIVDDRIIERSYGDLEGKYHKNVIKKYGKKTI